MQVESTKIYSGSKNYDLDVSVKSSSIKPHTATVSKFSSISNGTLTLGSNPNLTTSENASTTKNAFDKAFLKSWFAQRNNLSEQTSIYFKYKSALSSSKSTNPTKEESANSLNLTKFNRSSSNSNVSNENSMYSLLPLGNLKNNNFSLNNNSNNEKTKILPKIVSATVKTDTMPITSAKNNSINLAFVSPSTNNLSITNDTSKPMMSKFSKVSVGDTDVNSILNSFYSSKSTNSATKSKPIRQILAHPPPPPITTTINASLVTKEEPKKDLMCNVTNTTTNQISHVPKNENKIQNQEKDLKNQNSQNEKNEKCNYLTPSEALKLYGEKLSEFEKKEINEYAEIWFLGLEAEKLPASQVKDYDDEKDAYIKVNRDHIAYRYEIFETLGRGSFGQVLKCFDHKLKEYCAIKIIESKKRFEKQGLIEVSLLQHLKDKDTDNTLNLVHMKEHFFFRNHLFITFEILGINLYEMIKKSYFQGFSIDLVRGVAISVLQCLKCLHKENIIHCDLKPENILLKSSNDRPNSDVKVIDFGTSCYGTKQIYTYIQSRFYRAPEIVLGIPYTTSIDMWSFGCVLVELFTGYPLFPADNEAELLAMIIEIINVPPCHILANASRRKLFFDSKNTPRDLNKKYFKKRLPGSKSLGQVLKTSEKGFVDFVSRCLEWDPTSRLSPSEALEHPWILNKKNQSKNVTISQKTKISKEPDSTQNNLKKSSNSLEKNENNSDSIKNNLNFVVPILQ